MISVVMLPEKRSDNPKSKHAQDEPCNNPISNCWRAPLDHLILALLPMDTVCTARISGVLLNRKAHFFSPSVNYTKLDGNANEPCMAVRNGPQGQMRVSAP